MRKKPDKIILQEELERRILHALSCEWETSLKYLDSPCSNIMLLPSFSLGDMKNIWGCWIKHKHEICLSRELVFNHSWDSVCEVLLHEMAHQYADEVLFAYNESPHGHSFRQACNLLHANPKASGNYKPLDKRAFSDLNLEEDKIMRRIRKLMALSESANKHEAEAAITKAHELISKYNKEIIEYNKSREFVSIFLGKPALRHNRMEYSLCSLLKKFYFIKGLWVPSYVFEKEKMGTVHEISGTAQNIQTASYIYDFVLNYIEMKWRLYNKNKKLNMYRKIDFGFGIIKGFSSKLSIQRKKNVYLKSKPIDSYSIISLDDPMLDEYFKKRFPRIRKIKKNAHIEDKKVLADGARIGENMVIHKGIVEKNYRISGLICS